MGLGNKVRCRLRPSMRRDRICRVVIIKIFLICDSLFIGIFDRALEDTRDRLRAVNSAQVIKCQGCGALGSDVLKKTFRLYLDLPGYRLRDCKSNNLLADFDITTSILFGSNKSEHHVRYRAVHGVGSNNASVL